jgi:uncharacterized SAM-binding protein YcdF (DUF218 family)
MAAVDSPPKANRWAMIGSDGAFTFLLSNLLIVATAGGSLLWQAGEVRRIARATPAAIDPPDVLVVLGARLHGNAVTAEYADRLRRAANLVRRSERCSILIVGGRTGEASVSEAEQGRRYLIEAGIPAGRILVEDRSAHTLENLRHARVMLRQRSREPLALITSRYHLARSGALARGLQLQPALCAAEEGWRDGAVAALRLLREGYLLHWYRVGKMWSEWTGNRRSLAKIS